MSSSNPGIGAISQTPDGALANDYEGPLDNGLRLERSPFELEKIYDYEAGGHHPVHLGDLLHQRYRVLHKLGHGGYAIVWLCRDVSRDGPRYVALKILMAEASTPDCRELRMSRLIELRLDSRLSRELFCLPLDRFEIDGPNGVHYVFVYPVLGPRVTDLPIESSKNPGIPFTDICFQVTRAMALLHEHGICHGDFRPTNILTHLSGLDNIEEDELQSIIGSPETNRVTTREGEAHNLPLAPQYLVYPVDWHDVASSEAGSRLITNRPCITDFGESYETPSPPPDLGIPQAYCSPEYDFELKMGPPSDVWALGCTLFEIRTGRELFGMFEAELDEHLFAISAVLGKLPEPWWSETWAGRRDYFKDEADESGRVVVANFNVTTEGRPRSLRDAVAPREGPLYELNKHHLEEIPEREVDLFSDLLARLLRFCPAERISPKEALEHDWFRFSK